jgi:predicted nucleic acid-binding Zn ribbon protein
MSDELDRVAPRESARNKARDKKIRGPNVVSVNPGLKKLAQHIAERRSRKKKTVR